MKKYGKSEPIHFDGLKTIDAYLTSALAPAPGEVKPPGIGDWPQIQNGVAPISAVNWGMLGNGPDPSVTWEGDGFNNEEGCGDCTVAGYAHADEALTWDEAEHEAKHSVSGNETVEEYFELTGGVDSGLACGGVLMKGYNTGLFGAKNLGFGELAGTIKSINFGLLDQVIASFGVAYIGINCPESAETQYDNNEWWTVVPGSPIAGGHCIILVGYVTINGQKLYVAVTWGQFVFITEAFLRQYMDEAWAVLMPAIAERGEFDKVNVAELQSDLAQYAPGYHDETAPAAVVDEGGVRGEIERLVHAVYETVPDHVVSALKHAHYLEEAIVKNASVEVLTKIVEDMISAYTHKKF
jgi:hypothetical protein